MSDKYVVAPAALDDIDEIAAWMRQEYPGAEVDLRFIDAVYDAFVLLADRPGIGHQRQDLTSLPVLFWTVMSSFAVIYRNRSSVEIVRVIRWSRDLAVLLADEGS